MTIISSYTHHLFYTGHSFVNGCWSTITKRIYTFQVKRIYVILFYGMHLFILFHIKIMLRPRADNSSVKYFIGGNDKKFGKCSSFLRQINVYYCS